jgi:hypothetical protein
MYPKSVLLTKWIDKDRTFDGLSASRDKRCCITLQFEENDFKGVVDLVKTKQLFGMKKVWGQLTRLYYLLKI